jgi:hypothetical protein
MRADNLRRGLTLSCGCLRLEKQTRHGSSGTAVYGVWASMKRRCSRSKDKRFADYGGRGITVCARWQESFEAFCSDMGPRPAGCTLERIDNSKSYEPGNCRWATRGDQQSNMRSNHVVVHGGESLTVSQWAQRLGVKRTVLYNRLCRGWSVERALGEDVRARQAGDEG